MFNFGSLTFESWRALLHLQRKVFGSPNLKIWHKSIHTLSFNICLSWFFGNHLSILHLVICKRVENVSSKYLLGFSSGYEMISSSPTYLRQKHCYSYYWGNHVRLYGQVTERGTFSYCHSGIHDQETGEWYYRLIILLWTRWAFYCVLQYFFFYCLVSLCLLEGEAIPNIAPNLLALVRARARNSRTVAHALADHHWV